MHAYTTYSPHINQYLNILIFINQNKLNTYPHTTIKIMKYIENDYVAEACHDGTMMVQ